MAEHDGGQRWAFTFEPANKQRSGMLRQQGASALAAQQQLAAGRERTDHGCHGFGDRPRQGAAAPESLRSSATPMAARSGAPHRAPCSMQWD